MKYLLKINSGRLFAVAILLFVLASPALAEVLKKTDLRNSLDQLQVPTLLIHGDRDTLAPLTAARYLEIKLPQARLVEIKGAGHVPFLTHTELCAQAINKFASNNL